MITPIKILNVLRDSCDYQQGETILIGVSGGADSIALLHVLHAGNLPIAVAHVNYGLRGNESDEDEKFVADFCAQLHIPFYVKTTNKESLSELSPNLQDAARSFRYQFFTELVSLESMSWCAVAHNSDDQLETLLIHLMRGSGLRGLSGIQKKNGFFIRPLLDFSRQEIETYLSEHKIAWRNDSSNETDDYLRNRIRHHLVPVIKKIDERNGQGLNHSIEQLASSRKLLSSLALPWIEKIISNQRKARHINKKLLAQSPSPHLLLNYILDMEGCDFSFNESEYLAMMNQQPGKQFICGSVMLLNDREDLIIVDGPNEMEFPINLVHGIEHNEWSCSIEPASHPENYSGYEAMICREKATSGLIVRSWEDGDKMQPLGFHGTKKVSDILTEMKLPLHEKNKFPVVVCGEEIVWVPGFRIAEKFRVTESSKTAFVLKWNR